ncbi:MAG: OFA family MFS transporter [Candidatus Hodarchaeota archaeon]
MDNSDDELVFNRYFVVIGAIVVQLCLGSIYAWSAFKATVLSGTYGWSDISGTLPFSAGLASFAIFMVLAGRLQDKQGPMKIAMIGGVLLGIGYILASLVDVLGLGATEALGTFWLTLTYGVIGGAGIGFAYVCPIAALVKWFPDIKGLITGIAVAGFGAGAIIFFYVEETLINLNGGYLALAFFVLGLVYLVAVIAGSFLLRNPPEGWTPAGYVPSPKPAVTSDKQDYEWNEMIRTPQFWLLWLMFVIAAAAGLMTIGNVKPFVVEVGIPDIAAGITAAWLVATCLSIFNAAGRIVWGAVSEKLGRIITMILMFSILGVSMILFGFQTDLFLIIVFASLIGFCFGGNFALFPSTTADYFGTKSLGLNYALVFLAYGGAGIFGPLIAAGIRDVSQDITGYQLAFLLLGLLAFVAVFLALISEYLNRKASR